MLPLASSASPCVWVEPLVSPQGGSAKAAYPWFAFGALPHHLISLIDLEARLLQVLHDALGELAVGIVGRVFLEQPAHQIAATADPRSQWTMSPSGWELCPSSRV
jgi:hypothetical protein